MSYDPSSDLEQCELLAAYFLRNYEPTDHPLAVKALAQHLQDVAEAWLGINQEEDEP